MTDTCPTWPTLLAWLEADLSDGESQCASLRLRCPGLPDADKRLLELDPEYRYVRFAVHSPSDDAGRSSGLDSFIRVDKFHDATLTGRKPVLRRDDPRSMDAQLVDGTLEHRRLDILRIQANSNLARHVLSWVSSAIVGRIAISIPLRS